MYLPYCPCPLPRVHLLLPRWFLTVPPQLAQWSSTWSRCLQFHQVSMDDVDALHLSCALIFFGVLLEAKLLHTSCRSRRGSWREFTAFCLVCRGSWPFGRKSLLLASSCSSAVCERSHRQKASAVTLAHGLGQSYQLRVGRLTAASVVCCGNGNTCSSSHCTAAWRCPHRYVVRTNLYPEKHGLF